MLILERFAAWLGKVVSDWDFFWDLMDKRRKQR